MDELQEEQTNFWAVGSTLTGSKDHSKFFIDKGIWEDGQGRSGNPINKPALDQIKKGDYLLMKSSSAKNTEPNKSITKLKAVGKVIGRIKDNYFTFRVAWELGEPHTFPKEFKGIWYDKTVEPMKADEMLRFARKIIKK